MKICLLNDSFPPVIDGVANVVLNYAGIMQSKALAEVMVGTPRYPDTDYSIYPYKVVPFHSIDTTMIVKGYRAGNPLDIKGIDEMADFHPDIIHTHCPVASTYLARTLRAKTGAPIIFTYHTKFDEDIARAVKSELLQKEAVKILVNNIEACDEVWTVSKGAGENLKALGYTGTYHVVSNGVDFAKGRVDDETVKQVTADYDLPEGLPVFLYVGRMMTYKGILIILEALDKLSAMGQDFRAIFIGGGPDLELFQDTARKYGLYENADESHIGKVYFTGPIYDRNVLRAWNTRGDLFLFPSTYDTNGIVVREAAACGQASVLIKDSCAAEGITDDRNGFLIERNADSMVALLARLSKDLPHVREVGQNAMDEIYISWEDSVKAAVKRYQEILELKAAGQFETKARPLSRLLQDPDYTITDLSDKAAQELAEFWNARTSRFDNMLDNIGDSMDTVFDNIEDSMDTVFDNIGDRVDNMLDNIEDRFFEMQEDVENFVDQMGDRLEKIADDVKKLTKGDDSDS